MREKNTRVLVQLARKKRELLAFSQCCLQQSHRLIIIDITTQIAADLF